MTQKARFPVVFAAIVVFGFTWPCAAEGGRVALVIGNDAYAAGPLKNAVNDARAVQKALTGAGFRVILAENANKVEMEQKLIDYFESIRPGDTALFYFAGHAVQIENENLLLPVDFQPGRTVIESKFKSMSLAAVFDYTKRQRPGVTIVIIDACRSNPAAESHSLQAGLAIPLNAGKDTYIAFSTSPNHVATDNPDGTNSWFTEALSRQIPEPGLTLDDVFTRVRLKVESATGGAQTPWSQTSLTSRFYFHPPKDAETATDESLIARWWTDAQEHARHGDWPEAIDLAARILKQKPGGPLEQAVNARLPYLQIRNEAAKRFDAGEYGPALSEYAKAIQIDPFDSTAGFEAANSALLADQLALAVPALESVRAHGQSAQAARAEAMLREISKAESSADAALKRPPPPPPAINDLFPGQKFGVPDFAAGLRASRGSAAMDYAAVARKIEAPPVPPAGLPAAVTPTETATVTGPGIHEGAMQVDIRSRENAGGRDLKVEDPGELAITSQREEVTILVEGKPVARKLPFFAKLAAGVYDLRILSGNKVLAERQVVIRAGQRAEVVVK